MVAIIVFARRRKQAVAEKLMASGAVPNARRDVFQTAYKRLPDSGGQRRATQGPFTRRDYASNATEWRTRREITMRVIVH